MQPKGTAKGFSFPMAAVAAATFSPFSAYMGSGTMTQVAPPSFSATAPTSAAQMMDERLLDAKLEGVEARTETKFAQLLGKMEVVSERIGTLNNRISDLGAKVDAVDAHTRNAKLTIISAVIGTGLAVAALAWGGVQIYQGGISASTSAFSAGMAVSQPQPLPK